ARRSRCWSGPAKTCCRRSSADCVMLPRRLSRRAPVVRSSCWKRSRACCRPHRVPTLGRARGAATRVRKLTRLSMRPSTAPHRRRLLPRTEPERLQLLSQRLIELQEAERRSLALELHDELGQLLTGVQLLLSRPDQPLAENVARAQKELAR